MSVINKLVNVYLQFLFQRAFINKRNFVKSLHKFFVLLVLFSEYFVSNEFCDARNLRGDSHTLAFNQQKSQLSFAETKNSKYGNTDNNASTWLLIIVIRGEGGIFLLWGLVVPGPDKKESLYVCLTLAQTFLQALQQPCYGGFPGCGK